MCVKAIAIKDAPHGRGGSRISCFEKMIYTDPVRHLTYGPAKTLHKRAASTCRGYLAQVRVYRE